MKIRNYTEKLSFEELKEIFSNYEEFEKNGMIGDCLLRTLTQRILTDLNNEQLHTLVLWMDIVATDCYRFVTEKAIEEGFKF
jgi:hypothetical protein